MSWYQKIRESGKLGVVREVAKFACKNLGIPGGGVIADAMDGYGEIEDDQHQQKIEKMVEIICSQNGEMLDLVKKAQGDTPAQQVENLAQFPGMDEKFKSLGRSFEEEITGFREFLSKDISEIKTKIDVVESNVEKIIQILEKKGSYSRKATMSASLSMSPTEREMVKKLLGALRKDGAENLDPATLTYLGVRFTSVNYTREAEEVHKAALKTAEKAREKGLIHYNLFINSLEQNQYEEALTHYGNLLQVGQVEVLREMELFPGGKYRPLKILGAGGFGVAFLCEDRHLGGQVVVKALLELSDSKEIFKEARSLKSLKSPYIIPLDSCGYVDYHSQGGPYIVMAYFDGLDLEGWLEKNGPFSEERGLAVASAIARGMEYAHSRGIYHRDLKPANILYREEGDSFEIKIIDFGLAMKGDVLVEGRASLRIKSGERSAVQSEIVGTLKYAPPEQKGDIADPIGPWSDVYSFGMTMRMLFFCSLRLKGSQIRSFPNVQLVDLMDQCLEDHPTDRPQNFGEVLKQLEEAAGGKSVTFPSRPGLTLDELHGELERAKVPPDRLSHALEVVREDHSEVVPKEAILEIVSPGRVEKGEILEAARVVLSRGRKPVVVEFPKNLSEPMSELSGSLRDDTSHRDCFEIGERRHDDSIPQNAVIEVLEPGRIRLLLGGKLRREANAAGREVSESANASRPQ